MWAGFCVDRGGAGGVRRHNQKMKMKMKMKLEHCSLTDLLQHPRHTSGVLMVMPCVDAAQGHRAATLAAERADTAGLLLVVHDTQRLGFVAVVNAAMRHTQSPWLGYMAQDAFAGRSWLALALGALEREGASLLGFNDGKWHGQLAAFGLARRAWAARVYGGDLFFSGYARHYADAELTLVAREQGVYAYDPASVLVELDWDKDRRAVDAEDRRLFHERKSGGFGGRVHQPALLALMG